MSAKIPNIPLAFDHFVMSSLRNFVVTASAHYLAQPLEGRVNEPNTVATLWLRR
jgi:hypothetical protein